MAQIIYEKDAHIGIVKFNRPEALNALNESMLLELEDTLDTIAKDSDIYVVVFTGVGKAFVAGADIKAMSKMTAEEGRVFGMLGQRVFRKIEKLEKVTIAAVNGFALGGGCELALSCDLRYAFEKAKFGQPEVTLGITPGFSGTQRLAKIVGLAKAKEMIYTGKMVDAQHAESIGLINGITSDDVLECAMDTATDIAANAPLAVKYSKQAIDTGYEMAIDEGNSLEANLFGLCFATEDQKHGMESFLKKEKATFKNQ